MISRKRVYAKSDTIKPNLLWLATNSCSAHIISFSNTAHPSLREVLERQYNFLFESFIMAAEGERATRFWYSPEVERGDFILVMEGTVATAYGGRTNLLGQVGGKNVTALQVVKRLGSKARHVVAAGTCAAYGGPYAAWPNPTGSLPLSKVLSRPVINVPGCPINPGWLLETLEHLRLGKALKLDQMGRPVFLFGKTVHSKCERLPFYFSNQFAENPGDPGCMYNLGCKGPSTRADCPERRWIDEASGWPVGVNTPCIGCTAPEFPDGMAPFFKHTTDLYTARGKVNLDIITAYTAVFTLTALGAHLAGQYISGRFKAPQFSGKLGRLPILKNALKQAKKRLR